MMNDHISLLNAAFYDDYERLLDPHSILCFQQFMWLYPECQSPYLSANEDGSIVATWRHGPESVALAFQTDTLLYADCLGQHEYKRNHGRIYLRQLRTMPFYRLLLLPYKE